MVEKIRYPTTWLLVGMLLVLLLAACATPATPADTPAIAAESSTVAPTPTTPPTEVSATKPAQVPTAEPTEQSTDPPPPTHTPTITPTTVPAISPTPAAHAVMVEQGRALFQANTCANCHGEAGEGIEGLGPALPGHSREAVLKQVREPRTVPEGSVQMPAYGPAQISDEELELIVAWIESLGPPMGAGPFAGSMTEVAHLRLALVSVQAGGADDAAAHLHDLVETVETEVGEQAQALLALLETGDLHEAEHQLEVMLAEAEGGELTEAQLYIILALAGLQAHNDEDAIRHLEQAFDAATGEEKDTLIELLDQLRGGNAHDVQHELERLLGEEPHGF